MLDARRLKKDMTVVKSLCMIRGGSICYSPVFLSLHPSITLPHFIDSAGTGQCGAMC